MRAVPSVLMTLLFAAAATAAEPIYGVSYEATLIPTTRTAAVTMRVAQTDYLLRRLEFRIDPERHRDFSGDGSVEIDGDSVRWTLPKTGGGRLTWNLRIDHQRGDGGFDSRSAAEWALFRADDLVPPATAVTASGARSRARLRIRAPTGWSTATRYVAAADGSFVIENPKRRFLRPSGWLLSGDRLGVVRETVAGTRVSVAAPAGQAFRRLDVLAMLRWTLPELAQILDESPDRILIVGAGDPMWRGGLSGPRSVFIHSSRPLITTDTTSPLLHELMHTVLPPPDSESDWVAEGLAERYSLELLVRSKTISRTRHKRALTRLAEKGKNAPIIAGGESTDATTARAVTIVEALDREIRAVTAEAANLDDVVRALVKADDKLSVAALRREAETVTGKDLGSFFRGHGLSDAVTGSRLEKAPTHESPAPPTP